MLAGGFRQRYLFEGREWQRDIRPKAESFLRAAVKRCGKLRLILDAHASIVFLVGKVLDLKSGVESQLVQKGRVGTRTWRVDDGSALDGNRFAIQEEDVGSGRDIAIAISPRCLSCRRVRQVSAHALWAMAEKTVGNPLPGLGLYRASAANLPLSRYEFEKGTRARASLVATPDAAALTV